MEVYYHDQPMNSIDAMRNWKIFMNFQRKLPLLCGLLSVAFLGAADKLVGADAYYINDAITTYPGTLTYPPDIDASNFVNNSIFTINFTPQTFFTSQPLFETWDTLNYTNNGTMMANSGFQFDIQSSSTYLHSQASSFNNSGLVSCGSANDTTDPLGGELAFLGYDQCVINATNIVNTGELDSGSGGLIQLSGQSVELSQSLLNIEGGGPSFGGSGFFNLNTNLWSPGANLTATNATTPILSAAPFFLSLTNSTPYINVSVNANNGTNVIRAVFLEDFSGSNVSTSVYFDPDLVFTGQGFNTIQWACSYLDVPSGLILTNYLYLENDFVLGASTNVLPINKIPRNFTLIQTGTTPLPNLPPPAPAGFLPVFSFAGITNLYDFANIQVLASPSTNTIPNQNVTNLPGRVELSGDYYLNLSNIQITGPAYMSLVSSNNFVGSQGALIQTPYADLNVGKTNGYLVLTNVMEASLPYIGGNIQAWDTRWIDSTGSNDFRVLIVASKLTPTILAQVQDLTLHDYSSNSIIISDTFNVMRSFNADAQSMLLTTNPPGFGNTSLDGELNLESAGIFWQSSVPNLRYLTNNGAIRMQNLALFGFPYLTNPPTSTITNLVTASTNIVGGKTNIITSTNSVVVYTTNAVSFLYNTALINNGIFMDQGSTIYAGNFESSGIFSNGVGSFALKSLTTTLTNGALYASADVSITASTLETSNLVLQASRSLTLTVTNLLTDDWTPGVTNFNIWSVGSASVGSGINMPILPNGNLLGTIITLSAPTNQFVANSWAGHDYGISTAGFTNNEAVGELRLDVAASAIPGHNGVLVFNAPGISNALYVDLLVLTNYAIQGNATNNFNFPWLKINTNMMIYFAQALENGLSVAQAIDDQSKIGANGGRLRWISSYAGYFSSTNLFYTNSTGNVFSNSVNTALAQSTEIDSDGDGLLNYLDPTPFFLSSELNFTTSVTNNPANSIKLQWTTIPNATNFIYYTTSIPFTNWLPFTNFSKWYYGNNVAVTNSAHGNGFHSPQAPSGVNYSAVDNGTQTNVWVFDTVTNVPHYYKVVVWPWQDYTPQ